MAEKNGEKSSLSVFFLIIAFIIILVLGIFAYKFYNDKAELQTKVDELNKTVNDLQEKFNGKTDASDTSDSKELSSAEKQELFNKAIKEQTVLIDSMILNKDFNQKSFTDKEIILILPDSSEEKIFSTYNDDAGFYKKATITDIERSAKKLFDRTIDVKLAQNSDTIKIDGENVIVENRSGTGILSAELLSVDSIENNDYTIEFKFSSDSEISEIYKLTVNYNNKKVIYKGFEKN